MEDEPKLSPPNRTHWTGVFQVSCTQESIVFPVDLLPLDFGVYISQRV